MAELFSVDSVAVESAARIEGEHLAVVVATGQGGAVTFCAFELERFTRWPAGLAPMYQPSPIAADLHTGVSMRAFRLADASAIAGWFAAPGLALPPGGAKARWPERLVSDRRILARIAEVAGHQVGFARLDCGPDRVGGITLVVAPAWRRRGLGKALFEAVLGEARTLGLRQIVASVDATNLPALDFFGELGFEVASGAHGRLLLARLVHRSDVSQPLDLDR